MKKLTITYAWRLKQKLISLPMKTKYPYQKHSFIMQEISEKIASTNGGWFVTTFKGIKNLDKSKINIKNKIL